MSVVLDEMKNEKKYPEVQTGYGSGGCSGSDH